MQVDVIHLSLGVEGFRVIACDERDDAIEVAIETTVPLACCPSCGHAEIVPKERKPLWVRDIPLRPGKQTWLIWWKRRFACIRCKRTCTETHDAMNPAAIAAGFDEDPDTTSGSLTSLRDCGSGMCAPGASLPATLVLPWPLPAADVL